MATHNMATRTTERSRQRLTLRLAVLSTRKKQESSSVALRSTRPDDPRPDQPVFHCGSSRPNEQFQRLCSLAGVKPKQDVETAGDKLWVLKDLRKTSATYYDEHMPESSIEILGHSVGGVTYRHYAHRDPLAFKAITSLPQPTAFNALVHGFDGERPCCRRKFHQA